MSPETDEYNCIAWAYEITDKWLWPGHQDSYWPSGVTGADLLESITQLFLSNGYEKCDTPELEEGYKKVAIYVNQQGPTHIARQVESGRWTSKLGILEDIEHETLEALEGDAYGKATAFLKKRRLS